MLIGEGWWLDNLEKFTSLEHVLLFVNKTFVTVNERSFLGSSNLSANFDINVESDPPSNKALTASVFSPFEFVGSTCKCVTSFSLAV